MVEGIAKKKKNKLIELLKGFTLIELLVVIAIIGILASLAITSFRVVLLKAQDTRNKSLAGTVGSAISQYSIDHGDKFPVTANGAQVDVSSLDLSGYLKSTAAQTQATGVAKYASNYDGSSFVAAWELVYGSYQDATSGNGIYTTNSAQNAGSVTAGKTALSGGLYLPGTGEGISIPMNAAYSNRDFTITFWLKMEKNLGVPAAPTTRLLARTDGLTKGWAINLDFSGEVTPKWYGQPIGWEPIGEVKATLPVGSCNFFALTWNNSDIVIKNITTGNQSTMSYAGPFAANNSPLTFGLSTDILDRPFQGLVDDIRYYDTMLTAAQIDSLYNEARGAFGGVNEMSNKLIGGWRLDYFINNPDPAAPKLVKDYSSTSNNGTATPNGSGLANSTIQAGCAALGVNDVGSSPTGKAFTIFGPQ